jgi:hypothetical protein
MGRRSNPTHPKRSREEKEEEFIQAIEQTLGFPLMAWQRPLVVKFLRAHQSGEPIDFAAIQHARKEI